MREHAFKAVLGALVSLAGIVGLYFLNSIENNLNALQCKVSTFGARNEFSALQLQLVVTPLDSIKVNSEYLSGLNKIVDSYEQTLRSCDNGKQVLAEITAYNNGLNAFVDHDWDKAIGQFNNIQRRTALREKSIANAWLHKYEEYKATNDPQKFNAQQQMQAHLANASELAAQESDYTVKQKAVAYLDCNQFIVMDDVSRGIECLNQLVRDGFASAAVYYNLSSLHAARGEFAEATTYIEVSIQKDGGRGLRSYNFEGDPDFKQLLADIKFGPPFRNLIQRLKR